MFGKRIVSVTIMLLMTITTACAQPTEGSASRQLNAAHFHTRLHPIEFPIRDRTKPIPNPNLSIALQHIQLFFNGVKPYYPSKLDEPVPNVEKQGAIIGLIGQITASIGKKGIAGTANSEKSMDSFFNATDIQLQQLKKSSSWHRIHKDILYKTAHLEKAQDYSIDKDFDGYLQTIIDELQVALQTKNYKEYAKASKTIIRLNQVILAVVK